MRVTLDERLSRRLRELALGHEASLFMVLATLVHVQMHLLSGKADIVVGTPVAGRQRLELEAQVGFYLNLLPLRATHDSSRTFAAALANMRAVVLDALAHQAYPFDRLVEEIGGVWPANRHPLFDVLLILQNNDPLRLDLPDVTTQPLRDVSITAKYDLNFMFEDRPSLELLLEYAVDLFDRSTAANIARDLVALAAAVAEDPRTPLPEPADRHGRPPAGPLPPSYTAPPQLLAHYRSPRRAQQRVDEHRDEGGVETHRNRQPGHGGVCHRLGQDDRRRGEAGDDIEAPRATGGNLNSRCSLASVGGDRHVWSSSTHGKLRPRV